MSELVYKPIEKGQEQLVSDMVWEVFMEFEAPDYSDKGLETFKAFIEPRRLQNEIENNGFKVLCCFEGDELAGAVAFRRIAHISLLFVKKDHHRRGIARRLMELAKEQILQNYPEITAITVNSSPYAVEVYKRLGFSPTDRMQEMEGLVFMPMKKYIVD